MEIKNVGVVGCGLMGSELTQACAKAGYHVLVSDAKGELLNNGLALITDRLTADIENGKISVMDKDSILSQIKGTIDNQDFHKCDLIIESVTENLDLKKKVFSELDRICPEHTILATNTSVLSIIDMAMATKRPHKVLGLHGSALMVPITEIVKSFVTSEETLQICTEFVKSLGNSYIISPDVPGFIINRLWIPFLLNAVRMVEAGIGTRNDIDTFFTKGFGLPVGPLRALDTGGLDTVLNATTYLYEELKDTQYAPPTLLKKMVAAGWLGRKAGKGFYQYK